MAGIFSKLFSYLRKKPGAPFSGTGGGSIRSSGTATLPRRGGPDRRKANIESRLKTIEEGKTRDAKRLAELRERLDQQSKRAFDKAVQRAEMGTEVGNAEWHKLNSSNVDRVRYGTFDRKLQVVFKDGSLYEYDAVEPGIFQQFLTTHSPGQFVWYVLRAYGYRYRKLGSAGSYATAPRAAPRFDEQPFAIPEEAQRINRRAGRGGVDVGVPVAKGVRPPPLPAKFWKRT